MNRAELLLSVLADGRPHSRQEIFDRVGFMLTNNAASEARKLGKEVAHSVERGVHIYTLLVERDPTAAVGSPRSAVPQAVASEPVSRSTSSDAHQADTEELTANQPAVSVLHSSSPGEAAQVDRTPTLVPGQLSLLERVA